MNQTERILQFLHQSKKPFCDDCLSAATKITPRQTVNMICRSLVEAASIQRGVGLCSRCQETGKIVNSAEAAPISRPVAKSVPPPAIDLTRPWSWEGNVQYTLVEWLLRQQYKVRQTANTANREPGIDIIAASPHGRDLLVSVKGWPASSENVQARHWFSGAAFDMALYWEKYGDACDLALAFPANYPTYQNLARRITRLRQAIPFSIYWVAQDGQVTCLRPGD